MELIPSIDSGAIEEGLDRANLTQLRRRFLHISQERLQRTRASLTHRQRIFLDALPLLFHCNHPMLPGFVSHGAPAGVAGFKPGKADLIAGKTLARSFCLTGTPRHSDIWAIYLMGSSGTLAHSSHSDFDVWLCHDPELPRDACARLQQKCARISEWGRSLRLDVHIFLMNSQTFSAGHTLVMDQESSGSAQRLLLLDEFYRTAVHIAGRLPLWWFAPTREEAHYTDYTGILLQRRYLRASSVLDFGSLHDIPAGEFLGAGVWQLYKAIQSPYKSILKLLLMESYVSDYPHIRPLSLDFKQRVYAGEPDVDALDPYLLIYRRIEAYFARSGDSERLELARRCFYYKVNKALSRKPSRRGKSWQRQMMENLARSWGWQADYLRLLDERERWKAPEVEAERAQLVQALNRSYQALAEFALKAGAETSLSQTELDILGRKLHAAFEQRPGKVAWINPGISRDLTEPTLTLRPRPPGTDPARAEAPLWQLEGSLSGPERPLLQASSPAALLLWSHFNGIVPEHPQFELDDAPTLGDMQLRRALARLRQWLPQPAAGQAHTSFLRPAEPVRALLLLNFGVEPPHLPVDMGMQLVSDSTDPFNFGGADDNLVVSADLVVENSWLELVLHSFQGPEALLSALRCYTSLCEPGSFQSPPELEIDCLGHAHTGSIRQRVRQWFTDITHCFYSGIKPPSTRFVSQVGGAFVTFQFHGPQLTVNSHRDLPALLNFLGDPQERYSPVVLDARTLPGSPLALITRRASAQALHVFYQRSGTSLLLSVVDEMGSLVQLRYPWTVQLHALDSLHIFLRAVLAHKYHQLTLARQFNYGVQPIEFHEIRSNPQYPLTLVNRLVGTTLQPAQWLDLKARAIADTVAGIGFSFTCLNRHFEWRDYYDDVYGAVARFILEQRHLRERYPVYLTDLDLSACRHQLSPDGLLQTSHYLRLKNELEQRLTEHMQAAVPG